MLNSTISCADNQRHLPARANYSAIGGKDVSTKLFLSILRAMLLHSLGRMSRLLI